MDIQQLNDIPHKLDSSSNLLTEQEQSKDCIHLPESSTISSSNDRETIDHSDCLLNPTMSQESDVNSKTVDSVENSPDTNEAASREDEWLDIMGSGDFKKKVLKKGMGHDTRPTRCDRVTVDMKIYVKEKLLEEHKDFEFIVGDMDVIRGIDMVICLMEKGEKAEVIIPAKLAYGEKGMLPDVLPDSEIHCEIELKEVTALDFLNTVSSEILKLGDDKRQRGNFFYERGEFIEAIHCYERAVEYLDEIRNCSQASAEESQAVVDMKLKVYNNMAASHLKLSAYSAALKSVELVLKIQPKNVKALFRKAKILGNEGCTEEAIVCLRIAAKLEPDTKVIQLELNKLQAKKKNEDANQKAMYQRMFPQSPPKSFSLKSKLLKWSVFTGSVVAVVLGMVAYRQYHS